MYDILKRKKFLIGFHDELDNFKQKKISTFQNVKLLFFEQNHHNHTKRRTLEMASVHKTFHVNHHKVGLSDYGEQHFGLDG